MTTHPPVPMIDETPAIWSLASDEERRKFVSLIGLDVIFGYADDEQKAKLHRMLARQKKSNQQMR